MNWLKAHRKALLIGAGSLLLMFGVMWQRCGFRGCPDVGTLKGYMPDEASTILDYQGNEVGKLYLTRRNVVGLDSLPEHVPNAFIAMEDKRFRDHGGVDWLRVIGAAWTNVKKLGIEEGSSTITMQLARNAFPEKLPANRRTLWRKIAEARVARAIEKEYTKQEILELYLNQIYFGHGAYGIEAAAQEYFGKPATKLLLSEAATLAALLRAPSRLNPRNNREDALAGRAVVLERMVAQELISEEEAEQARKARMRLRQGSLRINDPAPYFVATVREILEQQLGDALYSDGYTIHTTLDARLQRTLEQELAAQLRAVESGAYGRYRHTTFAVARADTSADDAATRYLQAAAIFMDTKSGDVRALIGGRSFDDSQFNRALNANRQPGSAFKPFVYAAAFAAGYSPTYRLIDRPLRLVLDRRTVWEPKNYDGGYSGAVSLRDALTYSKNVPTIRLANEIGISRVIDMARQMGLSGRIPAVPSVVLGAAEIAPIDLNGAFAAFATLGDRPTPRFVTKVVDRGGNVVWAQQTESRSVIDPAVAFMTVSLMQDVVNRGTGHGVRAAGYSSPAAGKTGTTNDAADIWFIGFTPDMVGTIWMGFDKRKSILSSATGGEIAAPVWGRVMRRAGERSVGWAPPSGIEMRIVDEAGNALGENCPTIGATRREYFIQGTAPFATCYPAYDTFGWNDSMDGSPDTTSYEPGDEGWWARMRARIFGNERTTEPIPIDTTQITPTNPPLNQNPATLPPPQEPPKPKPVPYDSLVKPKLDTIPVEQEDSTVLRL
ncbi:MAG: transglycosylase domain-containing protein [Gemmatimonadota bacterium]